MKPETLRMTTEHCLKARGFAGLKSSKGYCACRVGDLMPCGAPVPDDCRPARAEELKGIWVMQTDTERRKGKC